MINNLNSLLLEGTLTNDPVHNENGLVTFTLSSINQIKSGKESLEKVNHFNITVKGKRLSDICFNTLRSGRKVRIVGYLMEVVESNKKYENNSIDIIAEHIEFKPVKIAASAIIS